MFSGIKTVVPGGFRNGAFVRASTPSVDGFNLTPTQTIAGLRSVNYIAMSGDGSTIATSYVAGGDSVTSNNMHVKSYRWNGSQFLDLGVVNTGRARNGAINADATHLVTSRHVPTNISRPQMIGGATLETIQWQDSNAAHNMSDTPDNRITMDDTGDWFVTSDLAGNITFVHNRTSPTTAIVFQTIDNRDAASSSATVSLSGNALALLIGVRQEISPFRYEVDIYRRANTASNFVFDRTVTRDALDTTMTLSSSGACFNQDGSRYAMAGPTAIYTFDDSRPSNGYQRFDRVALGLSASYGSFIDCAITDDGNLIVIATRGCRDFETETENVRFVVLKATAGQSYVVYHIEKSASYDPMDGTRIDISGDGSRLAVSSDAGTSADSLIIYT